MSSVEQRLRRIDLRRLDHLAAALLMVDLIFETVLEHGIPDRLATALLAVPFGATIAVRRRWPPGALIGCSVVALVQEPFHGQLFSLDSQSVLFPFGLCAYGAGAWMPWRRGLVALAVAILLLCVDQAIQVYVTEVPGPVGWALGSRWRSSCWGCHGWSVASSESGVAGPRRSRRWPTRPRPSRHNASGLRSSRSM